MAIWVSDAENIQFTGKSATVGPFNLNGGRYGVTAFATWGGGSATLQKLAADGTTYVTCLTAFTANSYATADLPPGVYQVAIATATGVGVDIVAIQPKGVY